MGSTTGLGFWRGIVVLPRFRTGASAAIPFSLPNTEPTTIPGRGRAAPAGSESRAAEPSKCTPGDRRTPVTGPSTHAPAPTRHIPQAYRFTNP